MKRILIFIAAICWGIGDANAVVRNSASVERASVSQNQTNALNLVARTASDSRNITQRSGASVSGRTNLVNKNSRDLSGATSRSASVATPNVSRAATANRTKTPVARNATSQTIVRSATATNRNVISSSRSATKTNARATTNVITGVSNTFGTGYNACRDAYFTCMDQFCAEQNDTYRRCVCSSRLQEIQSKERALSQASDQITDFKDLNIEVIPKTAAEVKAMLNATEGEMYANISNDKSASAQALAGISEVLSNTKSKSLSTLGTLDIAGDINQIWATTDLASGVNIANLTGEQLYNAVHSQCVNLIAENCSSTATLNMVVSAYGMYIENDCTQLANALDKKLNTANGTIRETEREMNLARLDNYNAHNSTSINDCIAQVRVDITADTACGTDYVHCLDVTGKYLNRDTGEPIYTPEFYQLANQVSLSGDVLSNPVNRLIVAELNRKRDYASRGLETCRDLADDVWDEFMRQALAEIYQGQQEKIRAVKTECLDIVNECYDEKSQSLKDFSNINEQLLLGSRLELSEELCRDKLDACSNLYGDGTGNGMDLLLEAMHNITDQKIAKGCQEALHNYALDLCSVPSNDSLHAYPYACRTYIPGEHKYALIAQCNQTLNEFYTSVYEQPPTTPSGGGYICPAQKQYTSCNEGYCLYVYKNGKWQANNTPQPGNACKPCENDITTNCGDYIGSLYQKMVRYAMQACVRPSDVTNDYVLPTVVLEDVNAMMDSIKVDMANALAAECDRLGGTWVNTVWNDEESSRNYKLFDKFYQETGASTDWGFCAEKEETKTEDASGTD